MILNFLVQNADLVGEAALAIGGVVAGWLGVRKRSASTSQAWDTLTSMLRTAGLRALADHPDKVRGALDAAAAAALTRLKIKRTPAVLIAVEAIVARVESEIAERLISAHLKTIADGSARVAATLADR